MERKAVSGIMLTMLLISIVSLAFNIQPVRTDPTTEIYLDPSDNFFTIPPTTPGTKFNVTVWVKDVIDIVSYQVHLTVDDDLLNITRAWLPIWDPDWFFVGTVTGLPPPVFYDSDLDGNMEAVTVGDYSVSCTRYGSGKLAIIEFQIKTAPPALGELSCPFAIDNIDTYLLDPDMGEIPTVKTNGSYSYTSLPYPSFSVVPSKSVVKVGEVFDINVTIIDLHVYWELVGVEFRLTSNWPQFELLNVDEGPFLQSFPNYELGPPYTFFIAEASNESTPYSPHVLVGILLLPNEENTWTVFPEENGTLATLTFRALEPGLYSFTLFDLIWINPTSGHVVPEEWVPECQIEVLPLIHDVAIVDIELPTTEIHSGQTVNVTVTAQNKGEVAETFNVTAYYDNNLIGTQTVVDLGVGENITLIFSWNTMDIALGNYSIKAEASILPDETDTEDNAMMSPLTIRIKMLGDVNGDNKIDIRDVAMAALSFGSYPNHPRWNVQADVYQDDKIDIRDLVLIAKNFGKTYL